MLKALVITAALLIGAAASADDGSSAISSEGSLNRDGPVLEPKPLDDGRSETILMGVLAAAVFTFQLRRKLKAATHRWQKILAPTDLDTTIVAAAETAVPEGRAAEAPSLRGGLAVGP